MLSLSKHEGGWGGERGCPPSYAKISRVGKDTRTLPDSPNGMSGGRDLALSRRNLRNPNIAGHSPCPRCLT